VAYREDGACRVAYCDGVGLKSLAASGADPTARPGPDTLFPCASLSKPVSTTLLAAAGFGRERSWEIEVSQADGTPYHLANSGARETLRMWLSHRSGLPDHGGDLIEDMNPAMSRDEILRRIMRYQTDVLPGRYRYTNFGFTMGCLGAAHALGSDDWEKFSTAALRKLGMSRSSYAFSSAFDPQAGDRAIPHRAAEEALFMSADDRRATQWRVTDPRDERNPSRQAPAGGLLSSARDMAQFLIAHLSGQLGADFPPRSPLASERTREDRDFSYSLGWNVVDHSREESFEPFGKGALSWISFNHSGAFALGASTFLRIDPDAGFALAILSNGQPTGVPETLGQLFFNHLYRKPLPDALVSKQGEIDHARLFAFARPAMMAMIQSQKLENHRRYSLARSSVPPPIAGESEIFRGRSEYYGCDIVIKGKSPDLLLSMGTAVDGSPCWSFPLRAYDGSALLYETTGENEVGLSRVRLVLEDGEVVRIVDDWLSGASIEDPGTGLGVIERRRG
jgi:CubicO group peptidase (beta-lactamase class C family)